MTSFSPSCSVEYSCRVDNNVIVNDDRWNGGTQQWLAAGGNLARYRTMVINHEVGHRLGHIDNETTCAGEGQLAPLMQEQSMHLDGCKVNEYPLTRSCGSAERRLLPVIFCCFLLFPGLTGSSRQFGETRPAVVTGRNTRRNRLG
ncbi:membrane protein [Bifidobacterium adolescentis]|nr:membrane protein [Bifidobacterium adolescentis]